jgi:hypothetical protein
MHHQENVSTVLGAETIISPWPWWCFLHFSFSQWWTFSCPSSDSEENILSESGGKYYKSNYIADYAIKISVPTTLGHFFNQSKGELQKHSLTQFYGFLPKK